MMKIGSRGDSDRAARVASGRIVLACAGVSMPTHVSRVAAALTQLSCMLLMVAWISAFGAGKPLNAQIAPAAAMSDSARGVERTRDVVGALAAQDFARARGMFADTLRTALSEAELASGWREAESTLGRFETIRGVSVMRAPFGRVGIAIVQFERGQAKAFITLVAGDSVAGLGLDFEPPSAPLGAYVRRDAFTERAVTVGTTPWQLPGTLSVPGGDRRRRPAVVLVHGSGPQDRDERIGPNAPFQDIAWGLASRGIVVLRYDKRTRVHAAAMARIGDSVTVREETIEDAVAAIRLLHGMREVNPARIVIVGHSLGALLAPQIAISARREGLRVAGMVLLAAPARPLEDILLEQHRFLLSSAAADTGASAYRTLRALEASVARVKSPALATTPRAELPLGIPAAYWLSLRGYDPTAVAIQTAIPTLVLQGGMDYQVTRADFERWERSRRQNPRLMVVWYPRLNHGFFVDSSAAPSADALSRPSRVADEVIDRLVDWVQRHPASLPARRLIRKR